MIKSNWGDKGFSFHLSQFIYEGEMAETQAGPKPGTEAEAMD